MTKRILIMGLPGSGKTTLSKSLINILKDSELTVDHLNADEIRGQFNDWDFSEEGRIRQSLRMRYLAENSKSDFVVADFVAPLDQMRNNYAADFTIWVDTIDESRFENTNQIFQPPEKYDIRVTEQDAIKWSNIIYEQISHKI